MDYGKIGFKAGLEIHQQLDGGKLFCKCPGYLRNEEPDFFVRRRLHAVPGETGEVDVAAMHESLAGKEFEYQGYRDTTCLIELDEEPPHEINEDALNEAIRISLLLNCEIVQTTQIMRKTVLDGSNTSGFQRTMLIGRDGFVETSFGKIGIEYVYLEEDAARAISRGEKKTVYRLDRLGIPMVEIVTAPDARNAEQVKELALKIGEILRVCRVKRGLGTIRQDINISIKGHPRAEIKGFQDPKFFVTVVDKEIERQKNNLNSGAELKDEVRGALDDGTTKFLRPLPGGARMYPETDLPLLRIGRERINLVKKDLPKLKTEIRDELKKMGLTDELITLVLDGHLEEFEVLVKSYDLDGPLVAKMVTLWRKELASKYKKTFDEVREVLSEAILEKILSAVQEGKLSKGDVQSVMASVLSGARVEEALNVEKVSDDSLEEEIAKIVKEKPGLRPNAYMGLVMAKLKGKVDAKKAMEILNRIAGGK